MTLAPGLEPTPDVTAPDLAPAGLTPETRLQVTAIRAFNRAYTRLIGLLDESLLHSPYTLTEVRVLLELAHEPEQPAPVARIRELLGLDAGYLSRILTRFEDEGLITKARSAADARRSAVALTPEGRAVFHGLDAGSTAQIAGLLAPLSAAERARLVESMGQVGALLDFGPPVGDVILRAPRPGDYGWVVERHGALYAAERAWDLSFEALVAGIVADFAAGRDPGREAMWIADVAGQRVGCIACVAADPDECADGVPTAKLRLLLVDPAARGLGVGRRLVEACVDFARERGYRRIVLYTVEGLDSARKIYEAFGFRLTGTEAVRKYGHDLVDQHWALDLAD